MNARFTRSRRVVSSVRVAHKAVKKERNRHRDKRVSTSFLEGKVAIFKRIGQRKERVQMPRKVRQSQDRQQAWQSLRKVQPPKRQMPSAVKVATDIERFQCTSCHTQTFQFLIVY